MVVIPQTEIFLLKSPLQIDNKNQLTFTDATAQYNYFSSLPKLELEDASYLRKDGVLRFNGNFEDIIQYNYCMYKNENYSNKWFYAFIVAMEYKNDNCTYIYLKTDVFQSWQFDLIFKQSYVEREMINVDEDTPGANLLPENLETGEYKIQGTAEIENLNPIICCAYAGTDITLNARGITTSEKNNDLSQKISYNLNGIPSSIPFLICQDDEAYRDLSYSLQNIGNQSEKIVAMFTVPYLAVKDLFIAANELLFNNLYHSGHSKIFVADGKSTPYIQNLISLPNSIDGYIPKNQKVRTYPYTYLGFNPSNGTSKIYRYEDFVNFTPSFKFISEINPNPTVNIIPQNYRGQTGDSLSDQASLNGYPQISSKVDVYNSWLAENTGIINVQKERSETTQNFAIQRGAWGIVGGIANAASSVVGKGIGGIIGGATSVASNVININEAKKNHELNIKELNAIQEMHAMLPDNITLGGSNATMLGYELLNDNIFTRYSIKQQFAERIDKYFDLYGYATNKLKIPNVNNRPNWNYIKTVGINIIGEIPETDLNEIKNLFDNGLTLWHNADTFLDYSQNNR